MPNETRTVLAPLFDVLTLQEAALWWGRNDKGILMRLMQEERKQNTILLRKSGKTWLTTIEAMRSVFGAPKNDRPDFN